MVRRYVKFTKENLKAVQDLISENPKSTLRELADMAGCSFSTMQRIRSGSKSPVKRHDSGRKVREVPGYKRMAIEAREELAAAHREIISLRKTIESLRNATPAPAAKLLGATTETKERSSDGADTEFDDFMAFREFKRLKDGRGISK